MLEGSAYNLAVITELIDHFDDFMLNMMAGLGQ